ncbi:MAG TPA: choice-of-anchor tandem repeat GloVer-containing protein [Terriglobales bacterium]|nr:choice-of-anchor tandem repeat GloVer-containing protein [Terriglobales bacterium]
MRGQNIRASHKLGISFASLPAWFGVVCLLLAATAASSATDTFTTRVNFNSTNGASPYYGSLVQGTDGDLYGTTQSGGTSHAGTIFKMTPSGTLTTIYNFAITDGAYPVAGLVLANNGKFFYGTTEFGGDLSCTAGVGCGTVFKIDSAGTLTTLVTLHGSGVPGGAFPTGALVEGTDGEFYGTTLGTTNGFSSGGFGSVFKITSVGTLTVLHTFHGSDGEYPAAGLIQGTDGKFYGTTEEGGAHGDGTVFQITSAGTLKRLYSFAGTDGKHPYAALVQAADGNFYGTTKEGGANGLGTVFQITSAGTLTTLYSFAGTDGEYPYAPLVQGTDGNFYGTTYKGGNDHLGTIFEITSGGTLTTLHNFVGPDGAYLYGGLVQRTAGGFYGMTNGGGSTGAGTVFSLAIGLGPFVKTLPTSGAVGSSVIILGTDLTGATSVTFSGTTAMFIVVSSSEIMTTVPVGATTGSVVVTTPSATLTSNVNFTVP